MRHRFVLSGLALALLSACSAEPSSAPASAPEALASSPQALSLLSSLRQRFVLPAPTLPARPGLEVSETQGSPRALLGESHAERWSVREGWLRPELPDHRRRGITRPASVRLPLRASGSFEVTDDSSGMRLSVTRVGARQVEVEQAEGWAMYRGGLGAGTDVLHRATAEGTEDFVHFAARPSKEQLRYRVDVSAVAGLRLVSNVLEFVNAEGDPRLRLTAPMLVDGAGERRELTIGVEGCAYSSDPAPPWGKAVVAPGASECEVVVRWEAGASYPLVIDPSWSTTASPVEPLSKHTASTLPDGRILFVGSAKAGQVWDKGTFSASGTTVEPRGRHTANVLPDGRVLIVGGSSWLTSEIWNKGTFTASGGLTVERIEHASVALPDGRVLVVGSFYSLTSSEIWDKGTFSPSGNLQKERSFHTANLLPDGRVLVAGSGVDADSSTSEIWNNGTFTISGNMMQPRSQHRAVTLADGRVLVVGGSKSSTTSEVWSNGTWKDAGNTLTQRLIGFSLSLLPDGRVLAVGGQNASATTSELWTSGAWSDAGSTQAKRYFHAASTLADGRVLAMGGDPSVGGGTAEIWSPQLLVDGQACTEAKGCQSGNCVDGVCCNTACDEKCVACIATKTGQSDGTCAPIPDAADPDSECEISGSGECATQGACDGKGACQVFVLGKACSLSACVDDTTQLDAAVCDSNGTCAPGSPSSCAPYRCKGSGCLTSCTTSDECAQGVTCIDGKCGTQLPNGQNCSSSSQCVSGFCVDDVCCNTACDQPCFNCVGINNTTGKNGTCAPTIIDKDPRNECPVSGEACKEDGLCNGEGQCRPNAKEGTSCGIKACAGDSLTSKLCDGFGACQQSSDLCPPFACDSEAKACKTKCSSNSDCSTGAVCSTNGQCTLGEASCADKSTAKAPDGSLKKCDPYTCLNGQCRDSCSTDLDCTSDFECNAQQCVPRTAGTAGNGAGGSAGTNAGGNNAGGVGGNGTAPASEEATGDDGGACGCRAAGSARSEGGAAGLLLGLALAARRRRRNPG